mmetsp:Transcript_29422/g.94409  ORF Transcript_29422/g.94409 Transcript_29422/m.94409 type:complete len:202 (-) Transcript_29422:258-863(-)
MFERNDEWGKRGATESLLECELCKVTGQVKCQDFIDVWDVLGKVHKTLSVYLAVVARVSSLLHDLCHRRLDQCLSILHTHVWTNQGDDLVQLGDIERIIQVVIKQIKDESQFLHNRLARPENSSRPYKRVEGHFPEFVLRHDGKDPLDVGVCRQVRVAAQIFSTQVVGLLAEEAESTKQKLQLRRRESRLLDIFLHLLFRK